MKRFALGLAAALALAGCQQQAAKDETNPDSVEGVSVSDGRLVLPAVMGNPGAAYFTIDNMSPAPVTVAGVYIDAAEKAEMHQTVEGAMEPLDSLHVAAAETVEFKPGGKHVMAFGLKGYLAPASKVEMTLTFSNGDKISAPLIVEAPGGGAPMGGMDHESMH